MEDELETAILYLRAVSLIYPKLDESHKIRFTSTIQNLVQKMDELIADYRNKMFDNDKIYQINSPDYCSPSGVWTCSDPPSNCLLKG